MHGIVFVNDSQQLAALCAQWSGQEFIALDTEFVREKTFYPITGLVQVSVGEQAYLLDPLKIDDWSAFAGVMVNPGVIKVLHSCGEDLEVLQRLAGVLPEPLYDTQLAAAFAGLGFSWSYARLVEHFLGIELAKDVTRSDWLQRPLSEQQLLYAAQDVTHLAKLFPLLDAELPKPKRAWMLADCAALVAAYRNPPPSQDYWQSVKQAWRLDAAQAAVLQQLCAWREEQARKRDLPRNRVVRESALLQLAFKQPSSLAQLETYEELPGHAIRRDGKALLECIRVAQSLADEQLPQPLPQPLPLEAGGLLKRLRSVANEFSKEQQMSVELVLKKKVLEDLLRTGFERGDYRLPDSLQGWRREMLGDRLLDFLKREKE